MPISRQKPVIIALPHRRKCSAADDPMAIKRPVRLLRIGLFRQGFWRGFFLIETAKLVRYCVVDFHHEDFEFPQSLVQENIYCGINFFERKDCGFLTQLSLPAGRHRFILYSWQSASQNQNHGT